MTLILTIICKLSEAVAQMCSVKIVSLKISHNSQENTCTGVYFLLMLQPWGESFKNT